MADEIIIETTSAEVIEVGVVGPQGPAGAAGTGLETLTTKGDTLYRGETTGERLPIGTTGQILRVSSSGLPEWGAAPASGVSSVAGKTGAVSLDSTDILTEQALQISDAGVADCNGVFVYGGVFNGRATYYATKDTFVYWDGSNWIISHNGNDQYFGTATTYPWSAVWSLGDGTNPLPVVTQAASHEFEQVVGQRTNPTARGDAASKNVGTGANDVAAGNHTHSAATQSVAGFLSAADKTKLDGIAAGAEVNVNADWNASSGDAQILNKPSTFAPSAHSSSHAAGGSDPLFDQDLNTTNDVVFGKVSVDPDLGPLEVTGAGLSYSGTQQWDVETGTFYDQNGAAFDYKDDYVRLYKPLSFAGGDAATNAATTLTNLGGAADDHVHGNLSSDGKLGSTAGLPVVTTTSGAITTLALGTANQVLRVNSGASGVEFADPAAAGVTSVTGTAPIVSSGGTTPAISVTVGTGANTVAAGDDSRFHTRSHAMTGTSDHTASNWSVFYSNGSGQVTELALGAANTVLTSNGASSAPSFSAAASGGTKTYAVFTAEHNQPPSTAFATLDTRGTGIAVLDFDAATDENAVFVGIMPESASLGSGLIVRLHWMATSATSGNVRWGVQFERSNTDLDSDSFDTAVEATAATNGTSGIITTTAITVTTIDGITAGDVFRLKVYRNADDATNDTMTGDAELVAVEVRSAA